MERGTMTTLIEVRNSEGVVGRCDAKCYNATDARCVCICGGANHGAGYAQAVENTADMVERSLEEQGLTEQLERFKVLRGLNGKDKLQVFVADLQPTLPGFEV
jgi:hypothetical protein